MTPLSTIGVSIGITFWLLFAGSESTAGSLYRCMTEADGTIYTDNPVQLERCSPITASGAVTSLATVSSGGPSTSTSPDPLPMTQAPPESTVIMPPPEFLPQPTDVPPPGAAPASPPCLVGINPLNPFSGPPCPSADAGPSATITMPLGPGAPP